MELKNLSECVTIVWYCLKKSKLEPTEDNINRIIKECNAPLSFRPKLPELVREKYKKNDPKFYAIIVDKETNNQITNCNIKDEVDDDYYSSYRDFLISKDKFKIEKLLNANSLGIINQIPDPEKSKANKYSIKGLVVGQIQSGKTANIEALVCRAVDFGYRFIIVLCGRTNALRLQTQQRFDNEITNTEYSKKNWSSLTNIKSLRIELGTGSIDTNPLTPKLAIIKKIKPSLEKIIESIKSKHDELKGHPVLIIDDECDDASIDTNANRDDTDPTITNQKIRDLIGMFDKSVYVGFSATPFANVFIDAYNAEDLYPKNFICLLNTPFGYTGTKAFIEQNNNFKTIEIDNDEEIPIDTLKEAIYSFILGCCISKEKKLIPNNNHTMLIHPSFKKDIHKKWKEEADEIINILREFKDRPKTFLSIKPYFEDIFNRDFSADLDKEFEDIFKHHKSIIDRIETIKLNSEREEEDNTYLNYQEGNKIYIVIGGNILSRGLTLEGLMTSIFTREAKIKNYDTLIQMQRWCGFRKDYLKFTKIYTTNKLKNCLVDLIDIEEGFRVFLKEKYKEEGISPLKVQPKIKTHPAMRVTNASKKGESFEIAYNKFGDNIRTLKFHSDKKNLDDNLTVIKEWVKSKKFSKTEKKEYEGKINKKDIDHLLDNYLFYDQNLKRRLMQRIKYLDFDQWKVFIHNPGMKENSEFYYTNKIKVKKVYRGLKEKGDSLTIERIKHKFQDATDMPQLFIYIIDEKSNSKSYPKKSKDLNESLEAPSPIVGMLFNFPKRNDDSYKENVRTQDTENI